MNRLILLLSVLFVGTSSFAQSDVVQWKFESKKLNDKQYEIRMIASVSNPWHIYSTTTPEGGPVPTTIAFTKNPLTTIEGGVKEIGKMEKHFEEVFDVETRYYNSRVEFVQLVTLKGKAKTKVSGTIEYMACNDKECLPPKEIPFTVSLQ